MERGIRPDVGFNYTITGVGERKPGGIPGMVDVYEPQKIKDLLAIIRRTDTPADVFRKNANLIFGLMGARLAEELPTHHDIFTTPVGPMEEDITNSDDVLHIAILRSAYPFAEGIQTHIDAPIAYMGLRRDEETAEAGLYYNGLPKDLSGKKKIFVPDPMLATGGSADRTIEELLKNGAKEEVIHLVALVSAPEGIRHIREKYPKVKITTAALDRGLNDKKYIVPGLGDFGDRYFEGVELTIVDKINNKILKFKDGRLYEIHEILPR
jgi:uracil phosphoribosyltransferase